MLIVGKVRKKKKAADPIDEPQPKRSTIEKDKENNKESMKKKKDALMYNFF